MYNSNGQTANWERQLAAAADEAKSLLAAYHVQFTTICVMKKEEIRLKKTAIILLLASVLMMAGGCAKAGKNDATGSETTEQESASTVTQDSKAPVSTAPESQESSEPVMLESNTAQTSVIEFSLDNSRPFDTIEEYLQTDEAKKMIHQLTEESGENTVIHTAVFAEGGTRLVFERQFSKDFNLWLKDDFLENVKKEVEAQESVFVALIDDLESCINKKVITVMVRYVDPENNVLYEHEFNNDKPVVLENSQTSKTEDSQTSKTEDSQTSKTEDSQTSKTEDGQISKTENSQASKANA